MPIAAQQETKEDAKAVHCNMSTKGSSGAKSGTQKDISLAYVLAGGILGWLLGQGVWPGSVISPLATSIPYFDGLAGSLLAKYNVPWGLNPSPRISSAANDLPSNVCDVSPATLAVIPEPFERDALQPLRTTKVAPNWQELQATSAGGKLKDCVFAAHDSSFHGLIGPDPTVKLLAQKDYTFAHEVCISWGCLLPVSRYACILVNLSKHPGALQTSIQCSDGALDAAASQFENYPNG